MVFKLAPQDKRKAACSRSSFVVEEKVKDPVSSYIPRAMIVASSGLGIIFFSCSREVNMVVVAPVCRIVSNVPFISPSMAG